MSIDPNAVTSEDAATQRAQDLPAGANPPAIADPALDPDDAVGGATPADTRAGGAAAGEAIAADATAGDTIAADRIAPAADPDPAGSPTDPSGNGARPPARLGAAVQAPTHALTYAVDIAFCIDVTGSMTPILDAVKANALRFYDDVQANLTEKGKHVDELRVRIIAFRDFNADPESALQESSFFVLPDEQHIFGSFVDSLAPEAGGDAPESGLEAVALAINSPWTSRGDRRRQVIVVWTDQPAHPLGFAVLPPELASSVPRNFSALTDLWEDPQGPVGASSKRLILFAPDGPGWSDISASWENVVHFPSTAGGGLSDVDYGTIIDSIGNSV